MDTRRITVFPRTLGGTFPAHGKGSVATTRASTHSLEGGKLIELELSRAPGKKIFEPVEESPGNMYQCIYIVDPNGERPYCLAQELRPRNSRRSVSTVMIRRSADRAVVGTNTSNPNLLNILEVFRCDNSIFTVFDRPGFPLSDIAVSESPQLGVAQIKTISKEALYGLCFVSNAGFSFPTIELDDITVSAHDGQVKIAFDRAVYEGPEVAYEATPFQRILENLLGHLPDPSKIEESAEMHVFIRSAGRLTYQELQKVDFLKDALPPKLLVPFVLSAQVSVLPVEYAIGGHIESLNKSATTYNCMTN